MNKLNVQYRQESLIPVFLGLLILFGDLIMLPIPIEGASLTLYRISIPLLTIYHVIQQVRNSDRRFSKYFLIFASMMIFWILYGSISMVLSPYSGTKAALKELLDLFLGLCSVYCIYEVCSNSHTLGRFVETIKISCVALLLLSILESFLNLHLPVSKLFPEKGYHLSGSEIIGRICAPYLAASTTVFYGINDFCSMIATFLPLFFYNSSLTKKQNVLNTVVVITAAVVLTANDSNISLLGLIIAMILFLFLEHRFLKENLMNGAAVIISHFWLYDLLKKAALMFKQGLRNLFGEKQSAFTPERYDNLISTVNISEVLGSQLENAITNGSGSLFNRIAIYFDAIEVTLQTCGLGIGPGSFTKYFQTHPHRSPLVDPHNWWIEILAQYGILVFLAYTGSFLYLLKHLITAFFRTRNTEFSIMAAVSCSFAVSCVAPSSFLGHNYQWAIAAIAVCMLSFEKEYRTQ